MRQFSGFASPEETNQRCYLPLSRRLPQPNRAILRIVKRTEESVAGDRDENAGLGGLPYERPSYRENAFALRDPEGSVKRRKTAETGVY